MVRLQHPALDGAAGQQNLVVATPAGDKRGAAEAVGRLLGLREPPTAVFAEQDEVAVAVIWTLRRRGSRCPDRCRSSASTTSRSRSGSI
ncbi:substrate-binding domain-containing protein [Streptomyces collinus]|uniref:substrate-binding domain-containing protein n=1 Tax=Streptomyces collinus TaxID=42684 RepID=UPI00368F6F15